ncbi:MAG: disulfide bond formation protein [Nevskia sp.]|nr:disulfide bond formation protein [Nevskia sp.]
MIARFSFRQLAGLAAIGCALGLAFALYLQKGIGYTPCAMCIFQRIALLTAGLILLIAALHGPQRGGRWVYTGLALLAAVAGAGVAARQVWLQSLPPGDAPACGPTPGYLWNMLPKGEALQRIAELVLKGDGDCAKIDAQWLGLTLPAWTLGVFILLALYVLLAAWLTRPRERLG